MNRLSDIVLSVVLLILCLPVLFLSCVLLSLEQARSPFVGLERVMHDGRIVCLYRLRIMRSTQFGLRPTPVGSVLRSLHLDEIPQLLNVVKGDLSLLEAKSASMGIGPKKAFALRQP